MYLKDEDLYSKIKNPATGEKRYIPKIYNPRNKSFVEIKRFIFKSATLAIEKAREMQEKIFYIYEERTNAS